jgi:hypothetical protein
MKLTKIFKNMIIVIYLVVFVRIYKYHFVYSLNLISIDSNDSNRIELFVLDKDGHSIAIEMKPVHL